MSKVLALILAWVLVVPVAVAQQDLLGVNQATVVRSLRFVHVDADRYRPLHTPKEIADQIATKAPDWRARLKFGLGLGDLQEYRLNPIELQRDVVRLRTAYHDAGYLHAYVDYAGTSLDSAANAVQVQFNIRQGPPVIIQDVGFYTTDGYLASHLEGETRTRWIDFRDRTSFRRGDRFTYFDAVRIEDQVLSWLKDEGFAFAELFSVIEVDSLYNSADISFLVDPGPRGKISSITIEGERRVLDRVVRRALPFKVGDEFAMRRLVEAQRALFGLGLFHVAQVELPPQPRDSTVELLITVRQARLRHLAAETGYHSRSGLTAEGLLSHRNFLGGARTLTATAELQSGLFASAGLGAQASRLLRASLALTQPYIGTPRISAVIEPFVQYERDPLLYDVNERFGLNRREYGINATVLYGIQRVRATSLSYGLSRATQFSGAREASSSVRDAYDKSTFTLSSTLGWTDNLLQPRQGVLIRPLLEQAGLLERWLGFRPTGLEYVKVQLDLAVYIPISPAVNASLRMGVGRLWPYGMRTVTLYDKDGRTRHYDAQFTAPVENRFDIARFYAGGADDVRGWNAGLIGPKFNRTDYLRNEQGQIITDGGLPVTQLEQFEPVGGLARLIVGAEIRFRIVGKWHAATFVDAGQVSSRKGVDCPDRLYMDRARTEVAHVQCGITDNGRWHWEDFKIGAGAGLRYETPIGYVRLDLAAKLNPDALDLQTPRNAFLSEQDLASAERSNWHRFNIHFSIGQAF